jgi:cytochrome c553
MLRTTITMLLIAGTSVALADGAKPNPYLQHDNRVPITVSAHERNHVLFDMRELLQGMFYIQNAMARDDLKAIPEVAMPMGRLMQHMPTEMLIRMPEGYMQLGSGMQTAFTQAAQAAAEGNHKKIEEHLGEAMTYCSGCHDTFRFQLGKPKEAKK